MKSKKVRIDKETKRDKKMERALEKAEEHRKTTVKQKKLDGERKKGKEQARFFEGKERAAMDKRKLKTPSKEKRKERERTPEEEKRKESVVRDTWLDIKSESRAVRENVTERGAENGEEGSKEVKDREIKQEGEEARDSIVSTTTTEERGALKPESVYASLLQIRP